MIDIQRLKEQHDLRLIVEQDLGPSSVRSGRAQLWKCPFHGERKGFSLVVWADGYRCFGKCQIAGDVFDWLQRHRKLSFQEAVDALNDRSWSVRIVKPHRSASPVIAPADEWQSAAWRVVEQAEAWLWEAPGEDTLTYLLEQRGLTAKTIREARLGVIPGGYRAWRSIAGLNVPCGITIPWITGETLWAVKIRRESDSLKYVQVAGGSSGGLYRGDALKGARTVLFCEGEFDALVAHQEAGDLVSAVTLGSASSGLSDRWIADLVTVPLILVAYDVDQAGTRGAARLQTLSRRVYVVRVPQGKDISELHVQGESGAVYDWLSCRLSQVRQSLSLAPNGR